MDLINLDKRNRPLGGKLEKVSFLVVDDERLMQVMIRQMLRNNGVVNLRFAESGSEGFRLLKAKPADVVVTDWHMPQMTGVELLQTIKNDADLFRTQVLIISSETSPLWLLHAFEEGVDGFLVKPFNEKALMESLVKLLRKQSGSERRKLDDLIRLKLLGQYQAAVDLGEQLLGEEDDAELSYNLAECLYHVGQYDEALKLAETVKAKKGDSKILSLVGKIRMEQGNYEEAVSAFEQAVDKNSLSIGRKIELAIAFLRAGEETKSLEILNALNIDELTDMNLVELSAAFLMLNDIEHAVNCLKKAHDPLPQAARVFNACGSALLKKDAREESIKMFRRCIKIAPEYPKAHYNLGLAYCLNASYAEAKQSLEESLRLKPDHKAARELLSYIKQKLTTVSAS